MLPFGFLSAKALTKAQETNFPLESLIMRFISKSINPGNWPSTTDFFALDSATRLSIFKSFWTYIQVNATDDRISKVQISFYFFI